MDFNIIQKDSVPVCPVDASGCFTEEVTHFVGQYVKVCALCVWKGVICLITLRITIGI
jgi:isoleucyl-tRNA synthetase